MNVMEIPLTPLDPDVYRVEELVTENDLLRNVVKHLWKTYQYHQEYVQYLLRTYDEQSEADFRTVVEKYVTEFENTSPQNLVQSSQTLLHLLQEDLTSADLSVLLNVDPHDVEMALTGHVECVGEIE